MMIGLIDILVIITLVISVLFALYRGLVRELLGIAAWILAAFAALYSFSFMKPLMGRFISNETLAGIVGAGLIAIVILIIMTIINSIITGQLRKSSLSGLDRVLGVFFGIFRAVLLIVILYLGASMFMGPRLEEATAGNFSIPYIQAAAHFSERFMPEAVKQDIDTIKVNNDTDKTLKNLKDSAQKPIQKIGTDLKKSIKEEIAEYKEADKKSLDNMIEQIIEVEELTIE